MVKVHRKGQSSTKGASDKERRCIVHGQAKPKVQMIRFVLDPENNVVPDLKANLPGRGVWVTATFDDIDLAVKKGLFSRGFKKSAKAENDLATRVEVLLRDRILKTLSLAKKAGLVTIGFENVSAALGSKATFAVILASDGATDSLRKMRNKVYKEKGTEDEDAKVQIYQSLRSDELGLALGRENVVHAALRKGGVAQSCTEHLRSLDHYLIKPDELRSEDD